MGYQVLQVKKKILGWEIGGFIFILIIGSILHFAFELAGFWTPIAFVAPVNESTWEHLKMVFWPGLFFFLLEYHYIRNQAANFWTAKALSLVIMLLVITIGWYAMVAITGQNIFAVNIALFISAILLGQIVSYRVLTAQKPVKVKLHYAILVIVFLGLAFITFTYYPPKIFLFEHMDLMDTGQYGILNSYEGLLLFRK